VINAKKRPGECFVVGGGRDAFITAPFPQYIEAIRRNNGESNFIKLFKTD
jgi:hypothetical protein